MKIKLHMKMTFSKCSCIVYKRTSCLRQNSEAFFVVFDSHYENADWGMNGMVAVEIAINHFSVIINSIVLAYWKSPDILYSAMS